MLNVLLPTFRPSLTPPATGDTFFSNFLFDFPRPHTTRAAVPRAHGAALFPIVNRTSEQRKLIYHQLPAQNQIRPDPAHVRLPSWDDPEGSEVAWAATRLPINWLIIMNVSQSTICHRRNGSGIFLLYHRLGGSIFHEQPGASTSVSRAPAHGRR